MSIIPIISRALPFAFPTYLCAATSYNLFSKTDIDFIRDEKKEKALKERFGSLLAENGIRNDLQFRILPKKNWTNTGSPAAALGLNIVTWSDAVIIVREGFDEVDPEALQFSIKHEFAHIKYNDPLLGNLAALITSLSFGILFPLLVGTSLIAAITGSLVSILITMEVVRTFQNYQEERADDFAIANSSDEELRGAIRFFDAAQVLSRALEARGISKESHKAAYHPESAARIAKVKSELDKRGIAYVESDSETKKVYKLIEILSCGQVTVALS